MTLLEETAAQQELDPIAEDLTAQEAARQLVLVELWYRRRQLLSDPALVSVSLGVDGELTGEHTIRGNQLDPYNGLAIFNPTAATVAVGFEAGAAQLQPLTVPPFSYVTVPERFSNLSLALPNAADALQTYSSRLTVLRLRVPPFPSAGPYGNPSEGTPALVASNPGAQVTVGTAGVASAVLANPRRRKLIIVNASATGWITCALGSAIPAMWSGIPLAPSGGAWEEEEWLGPVSIIAAANGTVVSIAEA
jgi:hypothetical protein